MAWTKPVATEMVRGGQIWDRSWTVVGQDSLMDWGMMCKGKEERLILRICPEQLKNDNC